MKYILKNSTPEAWEKLIKTCKYFFSKNPVFPVGRLYSDDDGKWNGDRRVINTNQPIAKLWLHKSLDVESPATISSLIPKLSKCSVQSLIIGGQNLTWEEYQFLTVSGLVTYLDIFDFTVKYSDGKIVTFDKLLENLKNVENLTVDSVDPTMFKRDTVKNMVNILQNLKKLDSFELLELSETFDISSFTDFLLENQAVKVYLDFRDLRLRLRKMKSSEIDKCCQKIIKKST
uniref:Uncharacterized protein n=1 Tax=Panagrolaimus superbus TaxID=310955 RepID=A0A914YQU3_9BILA